MSGGQKTRRVRVPSIAPITNPHTKGAPTSAPCFFAPTTNIWKITTKNNSWKFVQICGWLKTTNLTNLTNNYLALVNRVNRALGILGALRELRVIGQPIQPATPPTSVRFPAHNEISEIRGIRVSHPTTKSASVRFSTHNEISEICGIYVSRPTTASVRFSTHNEISEICGISVSQVLHKSVSTQKRRAPRWVRCTPCDWNQSNPISESLIIHLFQV